MRKASDLTIQEASSKIDRALSGQQRLLEGVLEGLVAARRGLRKLSEGLAEGSGATGGSGRPKTTPRGKRKRLSAAARKRIGEAMKKRWAERKRKAKSSGKIQDTLASRESV